MGRGQHKPAAASKILHSVSRACLWTEESPGIRSPCCTTCHTFAARRQCWPLSNCGRSQLPLCTPLPASSPAASAAWAAAASAVAHNCRRTTTACPPAQRGRTGSGRSYMARGCALSGLSTAWPHTPRRRSEPPPARHAAHTPTIAAQAANAQPSRGSGCRGSDASWVVHDWPTAGCLQISPAVPSHSLACGASSSPAQSAPSKQRLPQRSCTQSSACCAVLAGMLSASGGGARRSEPAFSCSQGSTHGTGTQQSTARGTSSSAAAQARHVRRRDSQCLAADSSGRNAAVGGGARTAANM